MNKYGAQASGGFGSKLEKSVYDILKMREMTGEISDIKCQQTIVLVDGSNKVRITWKVDFSFIDNETGKLCYCEAKGVETEPYRLKKKLFRKFIPHRLEIWKGSWRRPMKAETIEGGDE